MLGVGEGSGERAMFIFMLDGTKQSPPPACPSGSFASLRCWVWLAELEGLAGGALFINISLPRGEQPQKAESN